MKYVRIFNRLLYVGDYLGNLFYPKKRFKTSYDLDRGGYSILTISLFLLWLIVSNFFYIGEPAVPGYWNPNTLFNLGRITGGLAIEDVLFMLFVGGIATFIYEFIFKKRIQQKKSYKPHIKAFITYLLSFILFQSIFKLNPIYSLIFAGFTGAIIIWIERKDLIQHSLFGGLSFLIIYFLAFLLFNLAFPDFIANVYNISNISGLMFIGIPLEEFLYGFSFGIMWAPIYEYEHGEKDVDI